MNKLKSTCSIVSAKLLTTALFVFLSSNMYAQKIDTVYYDKDGVGISTPAFAAYYRVYAPNTLIGNKKRFRDYYSNGQIKVEGEYDYIDTEYDNNTIFDGECISYYENGNIKEKRKLQNGYLNGEYISYYENGLVELHTFFNNGKKDGIDTYFDISTQRCYQKVMRDDEPLHDFCIISDENGYVSKVRLSNHVVMWDDPQYIDMQSFWSNDSKWLYYRKNGILIALTNDIVDDYGKWFRITVNVSNHTLVPIDFGCENFRATISKKNGKTEALKVYDANLFMNKVKKKQNASLIAASIFQGLAAAAAGYSSSTSYSNTNYSGQSNTYANASAYGSGGYGYATYNGTTNYSGRSSTTTTTTSYNGFAAYQAQMIASNRLASMEDAMWQERAQRYEGYLKKTTIRPGETVSGYLYILREKGESMKLIVDLYGAKYEFRWSL